MASGLNHAVAYTEGGAAYAWGRNRCGELGTGTFDSVTKPVRILNDVNVVDVAVGAEHTLALASDGRLYAFGCNARGALGIGSADVGRFSTPQAVTSPETFVAIAAAGAHSVGLTAGGGVYTWGANNQGQLGAFEDSRRTDRGLSEPRALKESSQTECERIFRERRSRLMRFPGRSGERSLSK